MSVQCVKSASQELGNFLKLRMPMIAQILYEFPAADVQLKMPSISINVNAPKFMPIPQYVISIGQVINNQATVMKAIGYYDFDIQLDLWTRDKVERNRISEEFVKAFNSQENLSGLSLKLADYFGVWCRFDLNGFTIEDSEAGAQRGEWRTIANLSANTLAIEQSTRLIMTQIEPEISFDDQIA